MKTFALVVAYYENEKMLSEQFRILEADSRVANYVEFVCTDDGSAITPAKPKPDSPVEHKIFRIQGPKEPWGHNLCRNVGCTESSAPWLLVTDIDHTVPPSTWDWLRQNVREFDASRPYRLNRRNAPALDLYHRHPDTHLIHRSFWEKCPFDEAGRGAYGQNSLVLDAFIRAAGLKSEEQIQVLPPYVVRYSRDVLPDASTTQFERKSQANKDAMKKIRAAKAARGMTGIPERLGVPYERVFA